MARRRLATLVALLGDLALATGCARHPRNYTDPAGPRYTTRFGRTPAPHDAIRVVTFNIQFGREIERATAVLSRQPALENADLLLLQEMDAPGTERIARSLGMNSVYVPSTVHPSDGRDFGNAVLSPWPIEESRKLLLPHEARLNHVRRAAAVATVRIDGRRLRVYSIHLETRLRLGPAGRVDQVETILDDARTSPFPVVVAGDFNSHGIAKLVAAAGYDWLTRDVDETGGWFAIDHVFARGLTAAARPAAGATDPRGASDHRPVWAVLRFATPAESTHAEALRGAAR